MLMAVKECKDDRRLSQAEASCGGELWRRRRVKSGFDKIPGIAAVIYRKSRLETQPEERTVLIDDDRMTLLSYHLMN